MRGLCSAVLAFQAVVIALATPVMIAVEDVPVPLALTTGLGLALLALLTCGVLRRPWGYWLGHAVQVASIALGLLVPAMFFVGALFGALWLTAFLLGRRIDADRARWAAEASSDGSVGDG